ncbi:hypothetical protein ACWDWU_16835 [Streptomyces sp. NPDC003442]
MTVSPTDATKLLGVTRPWRQDILEMFFFDRLADLPGWDLPGAWQPACSGKMWEFVGGHIGSGKTFAPLSIMLAADRAIAAISADDLVRIRLRRRLLASVEDDTGLPSITVLITYDGLAATLGPSRPLLSEQQVIEVAETWREIYRIARDLVEQHICCQHYVFVHHPPPLETSPCGVIGFAAPRIPRAPGRPVYSPDPSNLGVAA